MAQKPLDLSSGFKTCAACKITKPLIEFGKSQRTMHGYTVYCKPCSQARYETWRQKNKPYVAAQAAKWRKKNLERTKEYGRKQNYGMPYDAFQKLLDAQKGGCAICKTLEPGGKGSFHVDHCHTNGHIRGLLCHHCNMLLGHARDNPLTLQAAFNYLTQR